jgi:acyl-CoA hydrolase
MKPTSLSQILETIARRANGPVFMTAGAAEPVALHDAFQAAPELAHDLHVRGLFVPGVNRRDYSRLSPRAVMETPLPSPDWRAGLKDGRVIASSRHYGDTARAWVRAGAGIGVFVMSAPNEAGMVSFGPSADLGPVMLERCGYKIAIMNARLPFFQGAPCVAITAFDAVVEIDQDLPILAPVMANPSFATIAARAAAFVPDGATIQSGIGRLPASLPAALHDRRRLRVHSGLIGQAHFDLLDAGAIADEPGALTAGIVLGDAALYARAAGDPRVRLIDVSQTHRCHPPAPNFFALNACLEVDLFGQINAEYAGAEAVSGVGGLVDFIRMAKASPGGRAIVALQADGKGAASRIVSRLSAPTTTVARSDACVIVTEFGAAECDELEGEARAQSLIACAPPAARTALSQTWSARS